LTNVTSE